MIASISAISSSAFRNENAPPKMSIPPQPALTEGSWILASWVVRGRVRT
jgi:hypothetical protein